VVILMASLSLPFFGSFRRIPRHATATFLSIYTSIDITNSVAKKPEGPSPNSQQFATGPCPEPVESNPHPLSQSPQDPF
jgi:hypothetical protein